MIIGITGASGAGKSVACNVFSQNGFFIVDLDKIAHEIYDTDPLCVNEVKNAFGEKILDGDGRIMRKKLGEIVFSDGEKLNILNKITHKYILKKALSELDGKENAVIDAPLLFETELLKKCDITLGILSDDKLKTERITKRDGVEKAYAQNRLKMQKNDDFFEKNCTFCIRNDSTADEFERKIALFIKNEVKKG